jgi:hypothetical protein
MAYASTSTAGPSGGHLIELPRLDRYFEALLLEWTQHFLKQINCPYMAQM